MKWVIPCPWKKITGEITPDVSRTCVWRIRFAFCAGGEVIARLCPGRQGEPGQDIYGKLILLASNSTGLFPDRGAGWTGRINCDRLLQ